MPTATVHIAELGGHAGQARCYRIDPPRKFGDDLEHEYVVVSVVAPTDWTDAEVTVLPSTETGASAYPTLRKRVGSFTPDGDPSASEHYLEGCFAWALASLGGYTVSEQP